MEPAMSQSPASNLDLTRTSANGRTHARRSALMTIFTAGVAAIALAFTGSASAQESVIMQSSSQRTQIDVIGGQASFTIVGKPTDKCYGKIPGGGEFFAGTLGQLRTSIWATSWSPRPGGKIAVDFFFDDIPDFVHGGSVIVKRNGAIIDRDTVRVH
jgi:hypothetical protein